MKKRFKSRYYCMKKGIVYGIIPRKKVENYCKRTKCPFLLEVPYPQNPFLAMEKTKVEVEEP